MPTYNRRKFVGQAIWYFLRQDYPEKELIIVDDGDDRVEDLVPDDARIRYIRLNQRKSLGEKRNLACRESHGAFIAHWDDDDWQSSDRLRRQKETLDNCCAALTGAASLLHYDVKAGEAWRFDYPYNGPPWLAGSTLFYRRSAWQAHPFAELGSGEDRQFVRSQPPEQVYAAPQTDYTVALIHQQNTVAAMPAPPLWQRRSIDEVTRLWGFDTEFYVALRDGRAPYPRKGFQTSVPTISMVAPFLVYDGYGSMAEYTVLGMERAGAQMNVIPLDLDATELTPHLKRLLRHSRPAGSEPILYYCWPRPDLRRYLPHTNLFINTMWESSQLPAGWAESLNLARAVIAPTRFVADVFRRSGVQAPVVVIPEGIDPKVYHFEERPERETFTTLIVGTLVNRKHTLQGIAAWKKAFDGDPDARLVIKARFRYRNYAPDDPRIRFEDNNEATRGIVHWYRQADVLLALGSEGFGLPLVEGMATGLPVIALNSEGQCDVVADADRRVLAVEPEAWEHVDEPPFGPAGVRGVPGIDAVAEHLRWVRTHQMEAIAIGRAASAWAVEKRNIWDKGLAVIEALERYVHPAQPLARSITLWTPSWGQKCGIAEYTADLVHELKAVRVTSQPQDMRRIRLLHIQHEPSLIASVNMLKTLQAAREAHLPVVVTEHNIGSRAYAWERECDLLISHTRAGVERLKRRWPHKEIQHIPHGCPTWSFPRKERPGRVIGVFGFMERHKGFWRLLEALPQLPGAELLAYSYAKDPLNEIAWERDAAGLPVTRYRDYLPVTEVARRLAARADVLVFWYDPVDFTAASGAVRVGLAAGVPVLTSPTIWFEDLSQVTYQPSNLVEGLARLLDDSSLRHRLVDAAREYCQENCWAEIARQHIALWETLVQ